MQGTDSSEQRSATIIPLLAESREVDPSELYDLMASWRGFRAESCECFDPKDKERMLIVIGNGHGGLAHFNTKVSELLANISEDMSEQMDQQVGRIRIDTRGSMSTRGSGSTRGSISSFVSSASRASSVVSASVQGLALTGRQQPGMRLSTHCEQPVVNSATFDDVIPGSVIGRLS